MSEPQAPAPQMQTMGGMPVTMQLMVNALFNPVIFDQVYEATLAASRANRQADPFSFVHRRMAEEIHYWRSAAAAQALTTRLHLETMRRGGIVADPGTPEQQIEESERVLRGHLQDLRDVLDYTFLPTSPGSGVAIRPGDPVIDTEEDGPMLASDIVKDPELHVVGAQIPVSPEELVQYEGEPPPPAFLTVRAATDDMTLPEILDEMFKSADLLETMAIERKAKEEPEPAE